MVYQKTTDHLLKLIRQADEIVSKVYSAAELAKQSVTKKEQLISSDLAKQAFQECVDLHYSWYQACIAFLEENDLIIEKEEFKNYKNSGLVRDNWNPQLASIFNHTIDRKALLINLAKHIEQKQNKEVVSLTVDAFDNFKDVKSVRSEDVSDYDKDCFLEDDVENAFLQKLGEPYKEKDGGAETRDLFTDRLAYNGKRLATVVMFKGRGEKGELTIEKCGKKGNQLLKLAKNNAAECFIVQHTNKINPDVREALQDHILQNTKFSKIYICFIDGVDTARMLKALGYNLDNLKHKTTK